MAEKYNWSGDRDNLAHYLVLSAITRGGDDAMEAIMNDTNVPWNPTSLDMVVTINGHELLFSETINALDKQLDRMVAEKAAELLEEKLHDVLNPLTEALSDIEAKIREDLGIPKDEW